MHASLTEETHCAMVAFSMRLTGRLPKHDHHNQTKEGGDGSNDLHKDAHTRTPELVPGIEDRRIEAVNTGRHHLSVGHVGVVILVTDVLARCDGGQTGKEREGCEHNREPCQARSADGLGAAIDRWRSKNSTVRMSLKSC